MNEKWKKVDRSSMPTAEDTRPGLTYWQDVWRRFRKNWLAMAGLVLVILIALLAVIGPMFSPYSYADQQLELSNLPPRLAITKLSDGLYAYVHKEFKLIQVSEDGDVLGPVKLIDDDLVLRTRTYELDGKEIKFDYSLANKKGNKQKFSDYGYNYRIFVDGKEIDPTPVKTTQNKTFVLGTDRLGRDMWTRTLYGARISLSVGVVAALVNMIIGVIYGGIAGYEGGMIDNVMMRIVDLINSIPLMLIVILLMVVIGKSGFGTIIVTIGLVYWVSMARQVRGQVLSLKEQEYVLAARTLGASKSRIIMRHLIPNALGPIVVSMTMSIPNAIFTESFLSFVGLGVSAPQASWGTLANDALGAIRSFPYQLIIPSVAIAITMFAFNFVGDGLRDALDPRLRK